MEKTTTQLGTRQGKLLFFGGVYGNLQALLQLKQWAFENGYKNENVFCTGDIAGYCAQPAECIELLAKWKINCIAGNVELQLRNNEDHCGCDFKDGGRCDLLSNNWYNFSRRAMTAQALRFLQTLPYRLMFNYEGRTVAVVHGSWFQTAEFVFASTPWALKQSNFDAAGADLIVAGHCGLPFAQQHGGKCWLNAGVIGMPANDGTSRVWFATLGQWREEYPETKFYGFNYPHEVTAALMLEEGLPASYAATLSTGLWDNCEILPETETRLMGRRLEL